MIDAHKILTDILRNMIIVFGVMSFLNREDVIGNLKEIFRTGQSASYRFYRFAELAFFYGLAFMVTVTCTTLVWLFAAFIEININLK